MRNSLAGWNKEGKSSNIVHRTEYVRIKAKSVKMEICPQTQHPCVQTRRREARYSGQTPLPNLETHSIKSSVLGILNQVDRHDFRADKAEIKEEHLILLPLGCSVLRLSAAPKRRLHQPPTGALNLLPPSQGGRSKKLDVSSRLAGCKLQVSGFQWQSWFKGTVQVSFSVSPP